MINVKSWEAGLCNRLVLGTGSDMVGCGCGNLKVMLRAVIGYHSVWNKGTLLYTAKQRHILVVEKSAKETIWKTGENR